MIPTSHLKKNGAVRPKPTYYSGRKYRSAFEADVAKTLTEAGIGFAYEPKRLHYTDHNQFDATYLPDFLLDDHMTIVEAKGWLNAEERSKLIFARMANRQHHIVLCLQSPHSKLSGYKAMTAADWCRKHDFDWASLDGLVPHLKAIGVVGDDGNVPEDVTLEGFPLTPDGRATKVLSGEIRLTH